MAIISCRRALIGVTIAIAYTPILAFVLRSIL